MALHRHRKPVRTLAPGKQQQRAHVTGIRSPQRGDVTLPRVARFNQVLAAAPAERGRAVQPQKAIGHQARVPAVAIGEWMHENPSVMEARCYQLDILMLPRHALMHAHHHSA